jgi:hypothetical protein
VYKVYMYTPLRIQPLLISHTLCVLPAVLQKQVRVGFFRRGVHIHLVNPNWHLMAGTFKQHKPPRPKLDDRPFLATPAAR